MNIINKGCARTNFQQGRANHQVEAVVIHLIDGSQVGCDATFLNPGSKVSAHYSIGKTGEIHQYVDEKDTAFHAGKLVRPTWPGLKRDDNGAFINPNFYTIGIEHEGRPNDEWSDAMYASSAGLLREISARHPALAALSRANVALHREIRGDKSCPGFKFDFDRLMREVSQTPPAGGGAPTAVTTITNVNLRQGRPSTAAPIARVIPKGQLVNVVGFVAGENVRENPKWYRTIAGDFFWAGATDSPNPL